MSFHDPGHKSHLEIVIGNCCRIEVKLILSSR